MKKTIAIFALSVLLLSGVNIANAKGGHHKPGGHEKPVVETPVVEEPVVEEPVVDEPVIEEPVIETPVEEPAEEAKPAGGAIPLFFVLQMYCTDVEYTDWGECHKGFGANGVQFRDIKEGNGCLATAQQQVERMRECQ